MEAIAEITQEYGDKFSEVFKTITGDNGQEFADLSTLELITSTNTKIYFTHPYSSFKKGTNERHNGLIRRVIPKGSQFAKYTLDDIAFIEDWCICYPGKVQIISVLLFVEKLHNLLNKNSSICYCNLGNSIF